MRTVVVTGSSGFLGGTLLKVAAKLAPDAAVVPIPSPRFGGLDLAQPDAPERLEDAIQITNAKETILVHAAAKVSWDTPEGLLSNAAMALNVATWARSIDIGFCVLVSSVNVYPSVAKADVSTPCEPQTLYGAGKLAAEHVWRLVLPQERTAIVRLAGIWGWQEHPTLFWNRLLLAAARGSPPEDAPVARRAHSSRNYISDREAAECLLQAGMNRMTGLFVAAGRDAQDTGSFVEAVGELPGSRLCVEWHDDGGLDEQVYHPSAELAPWLKPFPEILSAIWDSKPDWLW